MASILPDTIADLIGVEQHSPTSFSCRNLPVKMGNVADIAYGGCAVAFAINVACATLDIKTFRLYSALGNFLSGASAKIKLEATINTLRSTRTFQTRVVYVYQTLQDGTQRGVLNANLDFQAVEPAELLHFSQPIPSLVGSIDSALSDEEYQKLIPTFPGSSEKLVAAWKASFAPALKYFERRSVLSGIAAQNLVGLLKHVKTTQDHLHITDKASYDWSRSRAKLRDYVEHITAVAFQLDASIAFAALTHNHMFLPDAAACGSLDFALRFFGNDVDFNEFNLREIKTVVGREGRTYSEAKLWNQAGELQCSMTQQCIMRPRKGEGQARI